MPHRSRQVNGSLGVMKECPLCGESMRLVTRDRADRVPGTGQITTRQVREWICPECDYWEETEDTEQ
jgi:YgiT-type zinc finger domain-containing protein